MSLFRPVTSNRKNIVVAFIITVAVTALSITDGRAQGTGTGSGGGSGTPPDPLNVVLSVTPSPVLVGHTVNAAAGVTGGTPPYQYTWGADCSGTDPLPMVGQIGEFPQLYSFCTKKVGNYIVRCSVSDSSTPVKSKTEQVTVEVLAPDRLIIVNGELTLEDGPGPTFYGSGEFLFELKLGEQAVGGCLIASCAERAWELTADEPTEWQFIGEGANPSNTPNYYFLSPYIHDLHTFGAGQAYFDSQPVGHVFSEFFTRKKVDVPKCDGSTIEVTTDVLRVKTFKSSPTAVTITITSED